MAHGKDKHAIPPTTGNGRPDLSQQTELLKSIVDSIQDGITVLDADLNVRLVNAAMERWYPSGTVIHGRKCHSVFQWRDEPCPRCPVLRAFETGSIEREVLPGRRDSPAEWLEVHAYPLKDPDNGEITGVVETIRDITKNRYIEERLRRSEEHHRRLFETITQGVIYQAADGTIISANPAAERILGLSLDQMTGKTSMDPCWRMIREDGSPVDGSDHPAMEALRSGNPVGPVVRGVFHPRRNEYVWLSITAIPLFMPDESTPFQVYATIEDITARRNAEAHLVENEEKYRQLFTTSPVALWEEDFSRVHARIRDLLNRGVADIRSYLLDHPQVLRELVQLVRILDVNEATLTLYGAGSREEFLDQLGTIFTDHSYEQFAEAVLCIARGEREFLADDRHVNFRGVPLEVRIHWAVVPGHEENYGRVVVSVVDLTERKQQEDDLRRREQLHDMVLSAIPDILIRCDGEGRHLEIMQSHEDRLVRPREYQVGHAISEVLPEEVSRRYHDSIQTAITSNTMQSLEYELEVPAGLCYFEARIMPYATDEVLILIRDMTDQKRAQDQVAELLQAQNTLLKETHHRMKNSFATAEALLSLQANQTGNPEVSEALYDAQSRITSMRVLYEKLLQTEQYQRVRLKTYLEDLARSVLEAHSYRGRAQLDCRIADVELDARRTFPLGAITAELVTNSLKYAFESGGSGTIIVSLDQNGDKAMLCVADDGRGMPQEINPETAGSLGLMLVGMMADQLGGSFRVESTPGAGTTGTVSFPLSL